MPWAVATYVGNCRIQVVADVVGQQAEHLAAVTVRDKVGTQQRYLIKRLIVLNQPQTDQLFKHAAGMHIACNRLGQGFKTWPFALPIQAAGLSRIVTV